MATLESSPSALQGAALTPTWLGRLTGIDVRELERMRNDGALVSIRPPGTTDELIPVWQLGADGRPLAIVPVLVAEARQAGLDPLALHELLSRRAGLTGERRLADSLRDGRVDHVLAAIRAASK